jgi:hypothetical protein
LTEEHEALSSTRDELSNRHNSLAVDYESLSEELESLKESYNIVIAEKNSLLAEQSLYRRISIRLASNASREAMLKIVLNHHFNSVEKTLLIPKVSLIPRSRKLLLSLMKTAG